uniref:C-type lectin domain family 4 member E-like n=1 Tax=Scatophagus argus TaxID=75038 RepID=UPI001ED7D4CB|nr:C-type lectin domain family 4 member E-like [Scatophagus argus]
MEEIYANVGHGKSVDSEASQNQRGPRSSERTVHAAVALCLGLFCVLLLAALIGLGVHYHNSVRSSAEDFSIIKANLTERLQASNNKLSSMSEERDLLNANLTEITKELNRLQTLSTRKRSCPAGWNAFRCSCYLLSTESGSWTRAREDCRNREADLVVIDSIEEQKFLSELYTKQSWIGLTDSETEGTWKWIDGTPLTLTYWDQGQPDNGGGDPKWGEEDCVQIQAGMKTEKNWNDLSCRTSIQWICEREA